MMQPCNAPQISLCETHYPDGNLVSTGEAKMACMSPVTQKRAYHRSLAPNTGSLAPASKIHPPLVAFSGTSERLVNDM